VKTHEMTKGTQFEEIVWRDHASYSGCFASEELDCDGIVMVTRAFVVAETETGIVVTHTLNETESHMDPLTICKGCIESRRRIRL